MSIVKIVQVNLALYCKYSVNAGDQFQFILMALLVSGILTLPVWQLLIPKFGKKKVYATGMTVGSLNLNNKTLMLNREFV